MKEPNEGAMVPKWELVKKCDPRCLPLADRHYTRQTPGAKQWTRPGYNAVLVAEYPNGIAVWCWWRPKWEDGRPGTRRKDKLQVIECTMFRREGETPLASALIRAAVDMLKTDEVRAALHLESAGEIEGLLTGVSSKKTTGGRSPKSQPGACYLHAGWRPYEKRTGKADVWLWHPWEGEAMTEEVMASANGAEVAIEERTAEEDEAVREIRSRINNRYAELKRTVSNELALMLAVDEAILEALRVRYDANGGCDHG